MATVTVYLTSYNMHDGATDADFASWADFVAKALPKCLPTLFEERELEVETHRFGHGPDRDRVCCDEAGFDDAPILRWLSVDGWEAWCSGVVVADDGNAEIGPGGEQGLSTTAYDDGDHKYREAWKEWRVESGASAE